MRGGEERSRSGSSDLEVFFSPRSNKEVEIKARSTAAAAGSAPERRNTLQKCFPPQERLDLPCCARKGEREGVVGSPEARFERGG